MKNKRFFGREVDSDGQVITEGFEITPRGKQKETSPRLAALQLMRERAERFGAATTRDPEAWKAKQAKVEVQHG